MKVKIDKKKYIGVKYSFEVIVPDNTKVVNAWIEVKATVKNTNSGLLETMILTPTNLRKRKF
jgi:hypothetical protein